MYRGPYLTALKVELGDVNLEERNETVEDFTIGNSKYIKIPSFTGLPYPPLHSHPPKENLVDGDLLLEEHHRHLDVAALHGVVQRGRAALVLLRDLPPPRHASKRSPFRNLESICNLRRS